MLNESLHGNYMTNLSNFGDLASSSLAESSVNKRHRRLSPSKVDGFG